MYCFVPFDLISLSLSSSFPPLSLSLPFLHSPISLPIFQLRSQTSSLTVRRVLCTREPSGWPTWSSVCV